MSQQAGSVDVAPLVGGHLSCLRALLPGSFTSELVEWAGPVGSSGGCSVMSGLFPRVVSR